jgi:hypothetical protein
MSNVGLFVQGRTVAISRLVAVTNELATLVPRYVKVRDYLRSLQSERDIILRRTTAANISRLSCVVNEIHQIGPKIARLKAEVVSLRAEEFSLTSQLNGTHGEATNEDDMFPTPGLPPFGSKFFCYGCTSGLPHSICPEPIPLKPMVLHSRGRTANFLGYQDHSSTDTNEPQCKDFDLYTDAIILRDESCKHYPHSLYESCEKTLKLFPSDYNEAQSAIISSFGKKKFEIDNTATHRREELVHASPGDIEDTVSHMTRRGGDTTKVKVAAERFHQKKNARKRESARCTKAFNNLLDVACPNSNQPQIGFNMGELLSKFGALPGAFINACRDMTDSVRNATDKLNTIAGVIDSVTPWVSALVKATVLAICIGVVIYAIRKSHSALAAVAGTLCTAMAMATGYSLSPEVTDFMDTLSDRFPDTRPKSDDEPEIYHGPIDPAAPNEAQGDDSSIPVALDVTPALISKLFVSMFSCGFFALSDKRKGTFDCLKDFIVSFPSVIKGVDSIVEFSSKIVLTLLNKIRDGLGLKVYDKLLHDTHPFLKWIEEVEAYLDEWGKCNVRPSITNLGILNTFISQGREHTHFLRAISDDRVARDRIGTVLAALAKRRDECIALNPNIVSARAKPVAVFLYGLPNAGKTYFAKMLAMAYLSLTHSKEEYQVILRNMSGYIYHRTPETEYWDGFANQCVTIFDDFLQKKEVAGGDSAALDIVCCLNGDPALLHMANINDKGTTYFGSKLVILSSNQPDPMSEAVTCIDAVRRRPDFYIELSFQPELCLPGDHLGSDRLDEAMLAAINAKSSFEDRSSVYVLQRYRMKDPTKGRGIDKGEFLSPTQLLGLIIKKEELNRLVFNRQPPVLTPTETAKSDDLLAKFRTRNENIGKKPAPAPSPFDNREAPSAFRTVDNLGGRPAFSESPSHDLKPPPPKTEPIDPNAPQVRDALRPSDFVSPEAFEIFHANFMDYLDALKVNPRDHPDVQIHLDACKHLCEISKIPWKDVEDLYYLPLLIARIKSDSLVADRPPEVVGAVVGNGIFLTQREWFSKLFSRIVDNTKLYVGKLWDFLVEYWQYFLGISLALGVAFACYKAFSFWSRLDNSPQSAPTRVHTRVGAHRNFARARQAVAARAAIPKGGNVPQSSDTLQRMASKVLRHTYHIFWSEQSLESVGQVTMLVLRIGLTNAHTCDVILAKAASEGLTHVWLQTFGTLSNRQQVSIEAFRKVHRDELTPALDVVMIHFEDCGLPQACDFRGYVPPLSDFECRSQLNVCVPDLVPNGVAPRFMFDSHAKINDDTGGYTVDRTGDVYTNAYNITYHFKTMRGHCGIPVFSDSCSEGTALVGLHKCGNKTTGGAAPLYREWIDHEITLIRAIYPNMKWYPHKDNTEFTPPGDNFPQCYPGVTVGITRPFHASTDTKLRSLPHASLYDIDAAPAVLDTVKIGGSIVNPYIKNRSKMPTTVPVYPFVPNRAELVSAVINNRAAPESLDLKQWTRIMTYDEAVYGIPGTLFASLDMTTSVGYPYVLTGSTSKRAWFTNATRAAIIKKTVLDKIELLKKGIRPLFLHMDVLKDERRTAAKVAEASTRVVVVGPLDLLIINRMYFGGFATWTQTNKITNGVTIGMNPYSIEFDDMCRRLFKPTFDVFGGDSAKFDLCQHPVPLEDVRDGINDWYGDEEGNRVRALLFIEFTQARHVTFPVSVRDPAFRKALMEVVYSDDPFVVDEALKIIHASDFAKWAFIYEVCLGHPSGSYLTALVNSWYSTTKAFIVAQYYVRNITLVLEWLHKERIVPMTLGDDFLIGVQAEVQQHLNALSFSQFSRLYGMQVTREDKTPITVPFPSGPPIFLKRVLYYSQEIGRWVGALDKQAIADGMCWMRKENPTTDELLQLFDHALMEYSFWGSAVYAVEAPRVAQAARLTLGRNYVPLTWSQARDHADRAETSGPSSKF